MEKCPRCTLEAINPTKDTVVDDNGVKCTVYECNCGYLKENKPMFDEKDGSMYVVD